MAWHGRGWRAVQGLSVSTYCPRFSGPGSRLFPAWEWYGGCAWQLCLQWVSAHPSASYPIAHQVLAIHAYCLLLRPATPLPRPLPRSPHARLTNARLDPIAFQLPTIIPTSLSTSLQPNQYAMNDHLLPSSTETNQYFTRENAYKVYNGRILLPPN